MLIPLKQLVGLPVVTKSGRPLGKLESLIFEIESQSIYQYQIKPPGLAHLFDSDLLVHRDQVLGIEKNRIVVDDAAINQESPDVEDARQKAPTTAASAPEPLARKNNAY